MLIPFGVFSAAGAGGGAAAGSYELIETTYGTGSSGVVTFSSLGTYASTYKHLQIRVAAISAVGGTPVDLTFNGDTATNYSAHWLQGNGSSVSSTAFTNETSMVETMYLTTAAPSVGVIDILDAFSSSKNKTVRTLYGDPADNLIRLVSGSWRSTSSLTSITLTGRTRNFTTASRFSLYGIVG